MFARLFAHAPEDSRRHRFAVWWTRYAGSVAFVSLVLLAAAGAFRIDHESHARAVAIVESQREACEASLKPGGVRYDQVADIEEQIQQSKRISPKLFPSIPAAQFKKLVKRANRHRRERQEALMDVDCVTLYPDPD